MEQEVRHGFRFSIAIFFGLMTTLAVAAVVAGRHIHTNARSAEVNWDDVLGV